jgi:arylsulfatase
MIDIAPTIFDITGITKPSKWKDTPIPPAPGHSLVPALAKDVTIDRDYLWWLHEGNRAIRVGDWKLVAAKGDQWELYDLSTDRAESTNMAAEMPEKVQGLEQLWQQQFEQVRNLAAKTPPSK